MFYSDYLPYKKKNISKLIKKFLFFTFYCSKVNLKKNEIKLICKNPEMIKVFKKKFLIKMQKTAILIGFGGMGRDITKL